MKTLFVISYFLSFTVILSCTTNKHLGAYAGFGFYYILKSDSTFEYRYRGHMIGDTAVGEYLINQDTVYFNYQFYDSSLIGAIRPPRPTHAIWKKSKLYPLLYTEERINRKRRLNLLQ